MSTKHFNTKKNKASDTKTEASEETTATRVGNPLTDLRATFANTARGGLKAVKNKVSQQRGNLVKIVKKKFPRIRERLESVMPEAPTVPEEEEPPLLPKLQTAWSTLTIPYVASDLHRLISRITVKTSGVQNVLLAPPTKEHRNSNEDLANAVVELVKVLTRRLEPDCYQKVADLSQDMLRAVNSATDMIRFNANLLTEIGADSKVVLLLRCVHQSMMLTPYAILRTFLIKNKMTKDVRTDDGWQISILLAHEDFIQVKHIRKEQSIDLPTKLQPDKEKNHWEYQWEVSMTFNSQMSEMTNSRLKINNLYLNEGMDPELEKELKDLMQNGDLIVF